MSALCSAFQAVQGYSKVTATSNLILSADYKWRQTSDLSPNWDSWGFFKKARWLTDATATPAGQEPKSHLLVSFHNPIEATFKDKGHEVFYLNEWMM